MDDPAVSRCVACDSTDVRHDVLDEKGAYPVGLEGAWCDPCYRAAIEVERICAEQPAATEETTHEPIPAPALDGEPMLQEPPKCSRCNTTGDLTEYVDEKGIINGFYCQWCAKFMFTLVILAETNERAAQYLVAYHKARAMLA